MPKPINRKKWTFHLVEKWFIFMQISNTSSAIFICSEQSTKYIIAHPETAMRGVWIKCLIMFLLLHSAGSLLHSKGCLLTFRSGTDLCLNRKRKINTNKSAFQPNMKVMFDDVQNREYNTIHREGTNTNRRLNTLIGMFSVYLFPKNKKLF